MAFRSSFERAYGFELLDDLHNFFPELMYDNELFDNEMAAYMRYRVRTLFPQAYTRHENIYNIYERVNRRRNFATWRETYTPIIATPPPRRPRPGSFRVRVGGDHTDSEIQDISGAEVPVLETPPPVARFLGVNTLGTRLGRNRDNWFASGFPTERTSWFASGLPITPQQAMEPIPLLFPEENNAFTQGMLNLLNVGIRGTGGLYQDVEVAPTTEQITTGSETRAAADVSAETVCAICMDHGNEETAWRVLRCSHMYHADCIDMWFQNHVACPVCRTDIRTYSNTDSRA